MQNRIHGNDQENKLFDEFDITYMKNMIICASQISGVTKFLFAFGGS